MEQKQLTAILSQIGAQCLTETDETVCDILWQHYSEFHQVKDEAVRKREGALQPIFEELSLESEDILFELISDLCIAYQRAAFLDGLRLGVRLREELE